MPSITVFAPAFPSNARLAIILAAAKLAGVDAEVPAFQMGVDNETEAYLKNCHPCQRFPTAKTEDGYLFEASSIVRYLARLGDKQGAFLYGRTAYEAAQVDQWIDFANGEVLDSAYPIMLHHMGFCPASAEEIKSCMSKIHDAFHGLEAWLETRTFIVGERLTAADVVLGIYTNAVLSLPKEPAFVIELFGKYKNIVRYVNTVFAQPKIVAGLQQMGHDGFAAEKPKEEKKAEAPKPKEEKPKKEEKPAAADDDDEPLMEEGPKKKNPLDALPPSSMVLDAWKREYSNNDTRTKAAPWFFENFDPAGYSAYWCKYKYNSDLKMQFMTANLVRGWFQRMEGNRKYAFGCVLIVGEEGNHEIRGFWIFRGQPPLPECILDVEDTELFEWTHIPDVKAEKEAITDYLCWEGPTIDKPVMEGRTFK